MILGPAMMDGASISLAKTAEIAWAHFIGVMARRCVCGAGFRRHPGHPHQRPHGARVPPHLAVGADGRHGAGGHRPVPHPAGMSAALGPLISTHHSMTKWFPPFWFLGLYLDLLPGSPAGPPFHELAIYARHGLTWRRRSSC